MSLEFEIGSSLEVASMAPSVWIHKRCPSLEPVPKRDSVRGKRSMFTICYSEIFALNSPVPAVWVYVARPLPLGEMNRAGETPARSRFV